MGKRILTCGRLVVVILGIIDASSYTTIVLVAEALNPNTPNLDGIMIL